ncbi:putative bacteriophage-like protein [Magnetofaba australis IT-1]|uniref:Putative bacteriophage-like protein n=2 Tax=Magnetofaba TaxID=1472292 RepID=A0A1Y2K483_9PROT|nr:putative bacteriophage-like protein [Magnetofaba australis IT-1]
MVKRLAFRIQELAYGGHSEETKAQLKALAEDDQLQSRHPANQRADGMPAVGARLIREWRGVTHQVVVMEEGFSWQGRTFKSLSPIAREITGTRWSGPRFFGLKTAGAPK